jgi:hypothetical protein
VFLKDPKPEDTNLKFLDTYAWWIVQWSGWVGFLKIDAGEAEKIEPLYISKVNTALQLALVGVAVMQPALNVVDTYLVVPILR